MPEVNANNLVSINEVLSEVLVGLDDEPAKKLTIGFYRARVKNALDELGYNTLFLDYHEDIEIPVDLRVDMPEGAYDIKQVHVFKGTPEDIEYTENVYWKKGMIGEGSNFTADRVWGGTSYNPFIKTTSIPRGMLYFTVQNGIFHLSHACENFDYIRIMCSGVPSKRLDDVAMVPAETREAIVLYVIEKCASYLKVRDRMYRNIQADAATQLDRYGMNGAWHEAKMRLINLDRKMLKDAILYNKQMSY